VEAVMARVKIKTGDQVEVIAGRDKGKRGKVLRVEPKAGRAVVEHVNMIKRHTKPSSSANMQGGIIEREGPIALANLLIVSPDTGQASRVGYKILDDGRKVRIAKVDGATLDQ
jgi:large subunit ribosomal protein L24